MGRTLSFKWRFLTAIFSCTLRWILLGAPVIMNKTYFEASAGLSVKLLLKFAFAFAKRFMNEKYARAQASVIEK